MKILSSVTHFICIGLGCLWFIKGEMDKALYLNTLVIALNSIGTNQSIDYINDKVSDIKNILLWKD